MKILKIVCFLMCFCFPAYGNEFSELVTFELYSFCTVEKKCDAMLKVKNNMPHNTKVIFEGAKSDTLEASSLVVFDAENYRISEIKKTRREASIIPRKNTKKEYEPHNIELSLSAYEEVIVDFDNIHLEYNFETEKYYRLKLSFAYAYFYIDDKFVGLRTISSKDALFRLPDESLDILTTSKVNAGVD